MNNPSASPSQTRINATGHQAAVNGPRIPGVRRTALTSLNVLAVVDATGSSGPFSAGIVSLSSQFSNRLPAALPAVDFGLCISRDLEYDADAIHIALTNATVQEFDRAVGQIVFDGGGDDDETFLDAIVHSLDHYPFSYSAGSRRVIIFFGSSSSKPTRDGKGVAEVAQDIQRKGIRLFVVATAGSNMHELATQSGGFSFELSNIPAASEVERVCRALTASVTNLALGGGSGTVAGGTNPVGLNGTRIVV